MEQTTNTAKLLTEDAITTGAVVGAAGEEIEITEQMIQQACATLADQLSNHHAQVANFLYN